MRFLKALMIGLLCAGFVQAAEVPENVKKHIQERIDKDINQGIVIAVIDADGVDYFSAGTTQMEGGSKVDENKVFEIGSISKTFTTLILADMVQKGEVALEDPISKYLPDGINSPKFDGKEITLGHLATHRSSLPRMPTNFRPSNQADPYADYTEELLYEFINGVELEREIGSDMAYSNVGMGLLGTLLARAADTDYETLLKKRVLKPLKMKHSWLKVNDKNRKILAYGHNAGQQVSNWHLASMAGAGAIKATTADMVRYISAQMGLKKSRLSKAMKLTQEEYKGYEMGLGWMFEGDEIVHHGGATGGYRAFSAFKRDGSKGVVLLTNSDEGIQRLGLHVLNPEIELNPVKVKIDRLIASTAMEKGAAPAIQKYLHYKVNAPDEYEFYEQALNNLGYALLGKEKVDDAIAIFELNVSEYPESSNPYDSLGEAYKLKGNKDLAIKHYTKSIDLNPGNNHGIEMLKEMGVTYKKKDLDLAEADLAPYLGQFQLTPQLVFTVSNQGNQLFVQLTGQPALPVYPSEKDHFYSKAVNAQISFNRGEDGTVESLTLHQNGNHNAPRIESAD